MTRVVGLFLATAALALAQKPDFVRIPPAGDSKQPFWIAATETTVAQFEAFVKATGYQTKAELDKAPRTWRSPGFDLLPAQPVTYVTVNDAAAYCASIDARLPTDAEWDYAARAGSATRHYWGEDLDPRYLWYRANSDGRPQPVATKLPNAWGLYDVEGNVWEWTLVDTPSGADQLANRRGASWIDCDEIDGGPGHKGSALIGLSIYFKIPIKLDHRYDDIGFRCARSSR